MYIGKTLKELRKSKKVTLKELSEKSGVQIATLSRIENMKMTGTLESHIAIAKALEIDITQLYGEAIMDNSEIDVRNEPSAKEVYVHSDKSSFEILTNKVLSKKIMPVLLTIETGGQTNKEQNKFGSETFLFVLEGTIEVHIVNEKYQLTKHNTLYFDSSLQHYYVNLWTSPAQILCITTPVNL